MSELARGLLVFAVIYTVYALGAISVPRGEIDQFLTRVPKSWPFAPLRFLLWSLLLPLISVFQALLLAFLAFCAGGLLMALQ